MKPLKIAINGFGRIGRSLLKIIWERKDLEVVAINDLADLENLAYLLEFDSIYGKWNRKISADSKGGFIEIDKRKIKVFNQENPLLLPWKKLDIDVAVECTGVFDSFEDSESHLISGAKKAVVSAPVKDADQSNKGGTILLGINEEDFSRFKMTSNGSCTTNAVAPLMDIFSKTIGVEKAILNTVHAYTASQKIVDAPDANDWRRGRAGASNIIPSTTGAAQTVGRLIKTLACSFDGISIRVPVPIVSLADITFVSSQKTDVSEINSIIKKAEKESRWQGIFKAVEGKFVSSDFLADSFPSIADLSLTRVEGGDLIKVFAWYDNEWGYSNSLAEHVARFGRAK